MSRPKEFSASCSVTFKDEQQLIDKIDKIAQRHQRPRGQVIRLLLRAAIKEQEAGKIQMLNIL